MIIDTLIQDNLRELNSRVAAACAKCGRKPNEITIVAVTKTHPPEIIRAAVAAGLTEIGESRVQEADAKFAQISHVARYHLIGHLQSNKAKKAVQLFDVIQSIDSIEIAREISRRAGEASKSIECLIEVNSSGETQKFGVDPDKALSLMSEIITLPNIKLTGLMTVGPLTEDQARVRAAFKTCHDLFEQARDRLGPQITVLSMGMSDDFEPAIEEGSTMIRIGTGLFGQRKQDM